MRRLGFSRKDRYNYETGKPLLEEPEFSTFRFTRRDKDWGVGEVVQVVYKPRRKGGGEILGPAEIISKERRHLLCNLSSRGLPCISTYEARVDGFSSLSELETWLFQAHGKRVLKEPINRLTLRWVNG